MAKSVILNFVCMLLRNPKIRKMLRELVATTPTPVDDFILEVILSFCDNNSKKEA